MQNSYAISLQPLRGSLPLLELEEPVLPQEPPGDIFWRLPIYLHCRVQVPQGLVVQLLGDRGEDVRDLGVLVHYLLADRQRRVVDWEEVLIVLEERQIERPDTPVCRENLTVVTLL